MNALCYVDRSSSCVKDEYMKGVASFARTTHKLMSFVLYRIQNGYSRIRNEPPDVQSFHIIAKTHNSSPKSAMIDSSAASSSIASSAAAALTGVAGSNAGITGASASGC